MSNFDPASVRADFPILDQLIHGKPLVYLDNAATTQKPNAVIEAISNYYRQDNANIHRGVHTLSERATRDFEAAREKVRAFLNARESSEMIFVRGATEAINLVAFSFARMANLGAGDEILISEMEHHANIVPWQMVCAERGCKLVVVPFDDSGTLDMEAFSRLLGERTKIVAITHVSNALGTVNPVAEIVRQAHALGVPVLIDGAQAVAHTSVDLQALGADFYVLSGHKLYGPTGIGVLYGKKSLLEKMPPWQGGGDMIRSVTFEKSTWNDLPHKFEAGTPDIAGAVGLGAAIDYLGALGVDRVGAHEHELLAYATGQAEAFPGVRIIGTAKEKAGVLSFVLSGVHPHDLGTILDHSGVAIRAGHHCAMPVMTHYGVPATARASFGLYNSRAEVDALFAALRRAQELFA